MNPYAVLVIGKDASNKEIIQAAALQMRQRHHDARTIAQAQKMLLDPVSRACQVFIHFPDLEDAKQRIDRNLEEILNTYPNTGEADGFHAPCLAIFDGCHGSEHGQ